MGAAERLCADEGESLGSAMHWLEALALEMAEQPAAPAPVPTIEDVLHLLELELPADNS
jgi:hypothetical protein